MNELKNDANLSEAVSRREQQAAELPGNLNERVMKSLVELETPPKSRQLWGYAALAAAASVALFLVLHYGKKQTTQEPVVAQKTVKPAVVPSPSIVEESQQGARSKEQGARGKEQEPVPMIPPQTVEPTPTNQIEAPRHFTAQPVQDITSPKDEFFFLASTFYTVAPKSHRDDLAEVTESEDPLTLSAKDNGAMPEGWTNVKNWSNSQKPRLQLTKKERRQIAVAGSIATKRWHIDITTMNSMRYGSRTVTPDFYLELRGDTLRSYLPYLGRAFQSPTMSPSIGLNFEEPVKQYKESRPKSNKYTQIDIDVKTREDSFHFVIEIFDSGQANIRVRSINRDPISFDGTMDIE